MSYTCTLGFSEAVHAYSTGAGLSQRRLALEVRVPLNPVLVACHRFKRTQADALCLPEILISEYALGWPACTYKPPEPEVEPRPTEPGGHTGQAHCSELLMPLHHRAGFLTPKGDCFMPLPRRPLVLTCIKSIHLFSKYRVHKFNNRRPNGQTNEQTCCEHNVWPIWPGGPIKIYCWCRCIIVSEMCFILW